LATWATRPIVSSTSCTAQARRLWQVLPLGPTGYGDSPYQCFSAFAGNPLLIDPEQLIGDGLLSWDELNWELPPFPEEQIDYGWVINWKIPLLKHTYERFRSGASPELELAFKLFCVEAGELAGRLRAVHGAGVPPDYFSETGQRWGNPTLSLGPDGGGWGYDWWRQRLEAVLAQVDIVRIDHFPRLRRLLGDSGELRRRR
jgi:4-alpha-glucanotransferase